MTRCLDYLFNIWSFTTLKNCQKPCKIYLRKYKKFPNIKRTLLKGQSVFKNYAKVLKFGQIWSHCLLLLSTFLDSYLHRISHHFVLFTIQHFQAYSNMRHLSQFPLRKNLIPFLALGNSSRANVVKGFCNQVGHLLELTIS